MKVSILELREMVAQAIRLTLTEAKSKKKKVVPPLPPMRSKSSIDSQKERQIRALPGRTHGGVLDMSQPLGKKSLTKRQGASGIGGWTTESRDHAMESIRALVRLIVAEEIRLLK